MRKNYGGSGWIAKLALVLVCMLMLCTLGAYAQEMAEEQPGVLVKLEIPETESSEASVRYLLVGEGDGLEAFDHYAPADGAYAERFAALWEAALQAEPQVTLTGGLDALAFCEVQAENEAVLTQILVNGETAAEVEGQVAYAILSEALGEVEPEIGEELEAYIWEPASIARVGGEADGTVLVCAACGELSDGSCGHDVKVNPFCVSGHTLMDGDSVHFCESCGMEYLCSASNSHTICIKCGNPWCYKAEGDHKELACGHRGCMVYGNSSVHKQCVHCGGYLCDGGVHDLVPCGEHYACQDGVHDLVAACGNHYVCQDGVHDLAPCGEHYVCDGGNHDAGACGTTGHYNCDDANHGAGACGVPGHYWCSDDYALDHNASYACEIPGHYLCDGRSHAKAYCQMHWACEAGEHDLAACGAHFACEGGEHDLAACGEHYACKGGDHARAACGVHFACEDGDHELAACGQHYVCIYGDHAQAACGEHYVCDGTYHGLHDCGEHYYCEQGYELGHDAGVCGTPGHYMCDGRDHYSAYCQMHFACEGGEHDLAACQAHYACASGEHGWAECGWHYACDGDDHGMADCGRCHVCEPGVHEPAACGVSGHYRCDGEDHSQCNSAGA